jgi:hypothetical protein
MEEKRSIDRIRELGGSANIGTIEDGAIVEMRNIGGRLLIIKERSIYEMVLADSIDPQRTNINLPPTIHKLIIDKGTESEIVAKTFLTAKTLFKPEYIIDTVNCDSVLSLTIDLLSEISLLEKEIKDYQEQEDKVSSDYEKRRSQKVSFELPSIINLESRCKTIFQKADHIEQILMDIITHFYTDKGLTKQSRFPKLYETLKAKYGEEDNFANFVHRTIYFMRIVREMRNGLDHRLPTVKINDFELQIDGNILSPTIELNHKGVNLNRTSLGEFLKITIKNLVEITEATFAFLAGKNARTSVIPYQLREIPEEKRQHKFVRYSFWTPIGNEGYYCQ